VLLHRVAGVILCRGAGHHEEHVHVAGAAFQRAGQLPQLLHLSHRSGTHGDGR
jgi:hypothetical protein